MLGWMIVLFAVAALPAWSGYTLSKRTPQLGFTQGPEAGANAAAGPTPVVRRLRRRRESDFPSSRRTSIDMNNLMRFTVCKVASHRWEKIAYPLSPDGEDSGTFLRCRRCGKENHEAGTHAHFGGPLF